MIFFLINRFRRKKLRARENRQTAEDQRSIVGSIGYIAGNMGYMEGNLSSMDYTYGGAAHYPLWKPPSGYFPRGEAPPPYDEAVAISQAEALSAQCAAAAAAAQVAANQRATMGMNSVELQTADINRRAQQMQQIQHHAQPQQQSHGQMSHQTGHVVPTIQAHVLAAPQGQVSAAAAASNQPQSHQITQSTTNLINININSGGNITTIATGENHQPPYSLQDEVNNSAAVMQTSQQMQLQQHHHQQQQQQHHQAQQQQQQQQQQMLAATSTTCVGNNANNTNRLHIAQSNSICVQTMTPMVSQHQQQHQMAVTQQQQQQQQQQQPSTTQSVLQSAQIMTSTLTANASSATASLSRQQHHSGAVQNLGGSTNANDCGYKNCHLNGTTVSSSSSGGNTVSRRLQRATEPPPLQQYVVDVEVNVSQGSSRGYHSLPPCANGNVAESGEVIASPTQFGNASPSLTAAISTPAIDVDTSNATNDLSTFAATSSENHLMPMSTTGHNTLPLQHSQSSKTSSSNGGSKSSNSSSSSSSKRYHRTMPRYYAVADPLTQNLSSKSSKAEAKLAGNSSANSNASSSTTPSSNASSSSASSKKPTCQCPVQHVPMSYMGSTQLSNAQNATNNAFFTVLSNKLNSSSSASNSPSPSQHSSSSARLQANSNTNSLNYPQQRSTKSSQSSSQTDGSSNNSMIPNSANNTMKRSSNVGGHCYYEGKIATISSGELINSTGSASSGSNLQQSQQQQHHHHGHAHHHSHHSSSLMLPPQHHDDSSPIVLGRVTKRSSSSSGDRLRSASSGSTRASMVDSTTITSPAAAAYLNSKNVGGGKMSLNSTINSVVSKVPSVISLPPTGSEQANNNYYHGHGYGGLLPAADTAYNSHQYLNEMHGSQSTPSSASASATTSKSTTLPKILRSKQRDVHNSSLAPSNINCNQSANNATATMSSSSPSSANNQYAVSQCSMPAYPKQQHHQQQQYVSNSANSPSTLSNGASSSSAAAAGSNNTNAQQQQPTNINNMQTQTITSTLAVNYCPEDSHLNGPPHSHNSSSSPSNSNNVGRSNSPFAAAAATSPNNSNSHATKQLPVCTTSKNCLNPKEHFLPNDTSLDDDYLSECENCKIAQSSKYYLNAEALTNVGGGPQETMTLQRKSLEECKDEPDTGYYRISHTLPTNSKKNAPVKTNNRDQWFSTIPAASSSSEEDINE
ncbi:putative uncharacterized protein DDB_G0282129 isoform X2 [Musca domestica]|uniref:Uncharacterized protein n=1 Tax=Musca domestica TaxID=7370 RepID=A0ABM3VFD7_MUSDO|nr:putative uncharacterized protein DDB_G0282129 isoform X2 [Musca domestica]